MTTALVESLHQAVSTDRLQTDLEWFSTVRRDSGGPGEDAAAEYMASRLRDAGLPVTVHEFPAFLSYPISATLEVMGADGSSLRCLTHSFARSTGPDGIVAPLVAATPDDLEQARGQVPLVDGIATPVTVLRASRAGCAGIVFANQDRVIHNMIGTTIWGTPELDQLDRLPQLPVVSVNLESGQALEQILRDRPGAQVKMTTEVKTGWVTSKLPEVRIPGASEPDLFCLVGAHYCSWDVGVTDNATGDACLMELSRLLWEHRAGLQRSVRLCWWPGHSHGRYSGSTWYADTFFTDLAENCVVYHNIDSPGVRGATTYVARHTTSEIEEFCQSVIRDVTGQQTVPVNRPSRAADQSFLANGVAAFSTYPFLPDDHVDRRPWTGGSANAWWWHTEHDTLDKADVEILALDTRVSLSALLALANAPVLPLRYGRTAQETIAFVEDLQGKLNGHLDLTPILDEARAFGRAVARLEALQREGTLDAARMRRLNETLLRIGRAVNPVIYSQRGRFAHDPAEWSPIMRATRVYAFAALAKAAHLPGLSGHDEYNFLRAQVVRESNRIVTALRSAVRLAIDAAA